MKLSLTIKSALLLCITLFYNSFTIASDTQPQLFKVKNEPEDYNITLNATIEAVNEATLSAQTSGRVSKINFDTNDYVKEGDILLEITNKEQSAQLAEAKANVSSSKAKYHEAMLDYNRYKKLYPEGAIAKGELDRAKTQATTSRQALKGAQASLVRAKEALNYTIVKAPFSGIITKKDIEVGETVSPGHPLFTGLSLDKLRAVTEIPQRYIAALRKHLKFTIILNNGTKLVSNDITLSSFAENQSHSFQVRINLPKSDQILLPGMWVKAQFLKGTHRTILIPVTAILANNELTGVYRDVNGKAVLTQVRLGKKSNGHVEVLAGLIDGDMIYTDAYKKLQLLGAH